MELQRKELIVSIHMENEVCSETTIELVKLQETTETRKTAVLNCYSQDTSPNYDEFVHNVTLDTTVLDGLISKCFLTIEDREEIMNQRRLSERNKMILNILMTRPYRTFQTFTEELIEFDRSKMDLVSKMKNFDCDGDNRLPFLKIMDISSHKIQLQKNFKMLVNELATTNTIVDHLISEDVLCSEDQAEICASDITKEQSNRLLLTKLMYKNAGACRCFLSALKEDTCDETLARRIEHTDVTEEDKIMLHIGRTTAKEKKEKYTREKQKCEQTENIIPRHIQEQHNVLIDQWRNDDETFVSTRAADEVLKRIRENISVIVSGNSGVGKTATMRHVALLLQNEGYRIIPTGFPEDLRNFSQEGIKTLFVIDDICGHFTLKEQKVDEWEAILAHIQPFLEQNPCKIIATCRLQVFKDAKFKTLSFFDLSECNLNSEKIKLTTEERSRLAEMYFKEHAVKVKGLSDQFDFFPLLCKLYQKSNCDDINHFFHNPFEFYRKEIERLQIEGEGGKLKYCCLVLCVLFNNRIDENKLKETPMQNRIEKTFIECKLNKGTSVECLTESFQTLEGTLLTKVDGTYRTIHDKLFDFLAQIIVRKNINLCIRYCSSDFIRERFLWKPAYTSQQDTNLSITLSNEHVDIYIDRLIKDWSDGLIASVFGNINMKNPKFVDILMKCLNKVDTSEKKQTLAQKTDIESNDSPLLLSSFIGNVSLTEWVLENTKCSAKNKKQIHPKINLQRQNGTTSLYIACENGHLQLVKMLLQNGADINLKNTAGQVPLHAACYKNHIDVVRMLLDNKSTSVNVLDKRNISPLYAACQCPKSHFDVMEILLQHNADVDYGRPPLFMTCENGNTKMSEKLIELNANVNSCFRDGVSPLFMACQNSHYDTVCLLLKSGADPNVYRKNGASPLIIASQKGDVQIVDKLLQHESNINSCTDGGESSLYLASQNGHFDVVCHLIEAGANLDMSDSDGKTALFKACQKGHLEVVSRLLKCKADINICTNNNVTPMEIAEENNHSEVASVLKEHEQDEQTPLLGTFV